MTTNIIKNYRSNVTLRHSFNELAQKTFGLDFEDWYQNGFWGDNYCPYSIVIDGKVAANVSVSRTDLHIHGQLKHFLQLGTVMTDTPYRNQGLIRRIMKEIQEDFAAKANGVYLFANDTVLDFYPKFGFHPSFEYQYSKPAYYMEENRFEKIIMDRPAAWAALLDVMHHNIFHGTFDMVNNYELIMFYVTKFMQENVFYHKGTETYVIAELDGKELFIHNVFSKTLDDLDAVIELFGNRANQVILGFVPADTKGYTVEQFREKDCTLFIKGEAMSLIETEKLRIPSLSHA